MRSIAIINQKGGCGKTTTAISLAGCYAKVGMPALLVDMDPQSHCAAGLAIPEQRLDLDVGDAMLVPDAKPIDPDRLLWRAARNLDLAPSRTRLAGLESGRGGLDTLDDKELRLRSVIARFAERYTIGVIDCSPSLGLLAYNAMSAADAVLIPVETSYFSLHGAAKQLNAVASLSRRLGLKLPVWLVPTIHDADDALARDLLAELNDRYADKVAPVAIRVDRRLKEAASFGQPIFEYAPESPAAQDYAHLAGWLAEKLELQVPDQRTLLELMSPTPQTQARDEADANAQAPQSGPTPEPTPDPAPASPEASAPPTADPATETDAKPEMPSRTADLLRRAQALQRRHEGKGTPVELIEPKPAAPTPDIGRVPTPSDPGSAMRRLFGVRPTTSGVLFVQPIAAGREIAIAGDFNHWTPSTHTMRRNEELGVFELLIPIPPGRHHYRLVVDGTWQTDQYNALTEPNPYGDANSVLVVAKGVRTASIRSRHAASLAK